MAQAMSAMGRSARLGCWAVAIASPRGPSEDARGLWPLRVMLAVRRVGGGGSIFFADFCEEARVLIWS